MAFEPTDGLDYISEDGGVKFGWVLNKMPNRDIGSPIGNFATDLSYQTVNLTPRGATGNNSFTVGINALASGDGSVSMGEFTTASGKNSTAIGLDTVASGDYSFAFGRESEAQGLQSVAGGYKGIASGIMSLAFGEETTASGGDSIAMGRSLKAQNVNSTSFGRYNVGTRTDTIFEIGGGISDTTRVNVMEVYINASPRNLRGAIIAPMLGVETIRNSPTNKILITKEYIDLYGGSGGSEIIFKGTTSPSPSLGLDGDLYTWYDIRHAGKYDGNLNNDNGVSTYFDGNLDNDSTNETDQYDGNGDKLDNYYVQYIKENASWTPLKVEDVGEAPVDGNSYVRNNASWVAESSGIGEAPIDTKQYVRQDATWSEIVSGSAGTGLEALDEGNGIGWRLVGREGVNYLQIATGAIDFIEASDPLNPSGVTGINSIGFGKTEDNSVNNEGHGTINVGGYYGIGGGFADLGGRINIEGDSSLVIGYVRGQNIESENQVGLIANYGSASIIVGETIYGNITNSSTGSLVMGFSGEDAYITNEATASITMSDAESGYGVLNQGSSNILMAYAQFNSSSIYGNGNIAVGAELYVNADYSASFGLGLRNEFSTLTVIGKYNATPNTELNNILFVIGNGDNNITRRNALEVYLGGRIIAPSLEIGEIIEPKCLITKEYLEANTSGSQPIDAQLEYESITGMFYDSNNNLERIEYINGNRGFFAYNVNGSLKDTQYTDTDGITVLLTITYTYDINDNLFTVTRT